MSTLFVLGICVTLATMTPMGDRLKKARIDAGFNSAAKAAKKMNLPASTYNAHENGQNEFGPDEARVYARTFRTNSAWLLTGEGSSRPDPIVESFDDTEPARGVSSSGARHGLSPGAVAEYDLRAGGSYGGGYAQMGATLPDGNGSYTAEQLQGEWIFPPRWLRGEMRLTVEQTDVIAIDGSSMVPDLHPGDRALIDRSHRDARQGGIFAVREGDGVIVKHVEVVRGSDPVRIICKSSNPTYSPFELILDHQHVEIIGRVAGKITRM